MFSSQKLVIQVSTSPEEYEVDEEEFLCPLYAQPDFPAAHSVEQLLHAAPLAEGLAQMPVLAYVPVATTEDTEDCAMFEIGLYCCSKWRMPV